MAKGLDIQTPFLFLKHLLPFLIFDKNITMINSIEVKKIKDVISEAEMNNNFFHFQEIDESFRSGMKIIHLDKDGSETGYYFSFKDLPSIKWLEQYNCQWSPDKAMIVGGCAVEKQKNIDTVLIPFREWLEYLKANLTIEARLS